MLCHQDVTRNRMTRPDKGKRVRHSDTTIATVLDIAQQLALELHPHKAESLSVTLDSSLERELKLESLGRMEFLVRLEQALHVHFPEQLLATTETPRDLLSAIQASNSHVMP